MFIICPKCSAKYKIPEGIQLESGQKLKCSACDFVFLKGEEAPFTLEEPALPSESPAPVAPTGEAFSEPLHSAAELSASAADSLPEAFKPIDTTPEKKKKGVGIVFLYLIFVVVLCALGWMFRDSLKPSIQTTFPSLALDETKAPPKVRQNALPVRPRKAHPVNQPVVEVQELPKASDIEKIPPKKAPQKAIKKGPTPQKAKPAPKSVKPEKAIQKPLPLPDEITPQKQVKPIEQPAVIAPKVVTEPIVLPPEEPQEVKVILPDPTIKTNPTAVMDEPVPVMPEPILEPDLIPVVPEPALAFEPVAEPEPDLIPLFEILDAPLPAGTAMELSVNSVSFRVEPTEEGVDQVLIEGQIQNNAPQKKSIPVLTVFIVDKVGHILAQKKVHTSGDDLESGAQMPFYTSLTPAPKNIDHIEVKF